MLMRARERTAYVGHRGVLRAPRFTSSLGDLKLHPMPRSSSALQRVNMNIAAPSRNTLRALAKAAGKPEAVYARELFLAALAHAEAEALRRQIEASRSPARRARDREIAEAVERLRA